LWAVFNTEWYNAANKIRRVVAAAVIGRTASAISGGKFSNGAVTGAFSRAFNDEMHDQAEKQSFWEHFKNRVMSGQVRDDIYTTLGAYAKCGAGLVGVAGGRLIMPFNPKIGGYMMADGASIFLGAVSDLSNQIYGGNRNYDLLGLGFQNAAENMGFDASMGNNARAVLSVTSMVGAWRTIVPRTVNSSGAWGTNALQYTETVYGIQTSSSVTATVDLYNARGAFDSLAPNN
jgi:hypothetical protein